MSNRRVSPYRSAETHCRSRAIPKAGGCSNIDGSRGQQSPKNDDSRTGTPENNETGPFGSCWDSPQAIKRWTATRVRSSLHPVVKVASLGMIVRRDGLHLAHGLILPGDPLRGNVVILGGVITNMLPSVCIV